MAKKGLVVKITETVEEAAFEGSGIEAAKDFTQEPLPLPVEEVKTIITGEDYLRLKKEQA